uniref:ATPase V1 complex subunit H C-terminal domain-containing protein n=1 Tax=Bicosoecida sp. CB-2014 TaxID=1486930 RepID=A0A7S1CBG2_9STRA
MAAERPWDNKAAAGAAGSGGGTPSGLAPRLERRMSASLADEIVEREDVVEAGRRIDWGRYVRAGETKDGVNLFLTGEDVDAIRTFGDEEPEALTELIATSDEGAGARYAQALVKVVTNIADPLVLRFALTLIEDLLEYKTPERAALFVVGGALQTAPFLRLLSTSTDAYVAYKAARSLAYLLSIHPEEGVATATLLAWVLRQLKAAASHGAERSSAWPSLTSAIASLMILLRCEVMRDMFLREHGVELLVALVATPDTQLCYEVAFCLWCMSQFEPARPVLISSGAVKAFTRLVRSGQREKILRMAFAALANIIGDDEFGGPALHIVSATKLLPSLQQLQEERKINDAELKEDAAFVKAKVEEAGSTATETGLAEYIRELDGGLLEWGACHTTAFWKENVRAMEAHDFGPLRRLLTLLDSSDDTMTLAVACFDVGEFARHHSHGRSVLARLGLKDRVMELIESENLEVRKQALLCCSKLMVSHWQFVKS